MQFLDSEILSRVYMAKVQTDKSSSQFQELLHKYKIQNYNDVERILVVYYLHLILDVHDDLYITKYGLPFIQNLYPNLLTNIAS